MGATENGGGEAGLSQDSDAVCCPCCGARLTFNLRVKVRGVSLALAPEGTPQAAQEHFSRRVRELGLLDAFGRTVADVMQGSVPSHVEKYLCTWLQKAVTVRVQRTAAEAIKAELLTGGRVQVQVKDGIGAIVVDGKLRCFVPKRLLDGGGPGKLARAPTPFPEGLRVWIRENKIVVENGQGVFFSEIWKDALAAEVSTWRF
jgi:hypothetical protein